MNISAISAASNAANNVNELDCKRRGGRRRLSFQGSEETEKKNDAFEKRKAAVTVPEGKAVQYKTKPGISLINILLLPLGVVGFHVKQEPELVDFDPENVTEKQEKLIRKGKLTDTVPIGYEIKDDKIVKVR